MDALNIVTVPVIVGIVFGGLQLLKTATGGSAKLLKFFPIIAAVFGAALGVTAFYSMPSLIPATNVFTAILVGGASGLAATGTHQVFKQLAGGSGDGGGTSN